jgi:uncharacterized membrane protein
MERAARGWHLLTAVITIAALVLQLWLALDGHRTLVTEGEPSTRTTLVRFLSYFTILSNILVAWTTSTLAIDPGRDGRVWRVLRLDAVVGITVTAVVHWFFLRPLLDLHGGDYVADKLLHVVVPLLAVAGWLVFGPRGRIALAISRSARSTRRRTWSGRWCTVPRPAGTPIPSPTSASTGTPWCWPTPWEWSRCSPSSAGWRC